MYFDDYEASSDVAAGRILWIDLVRKSNMNLLGSGTVAWEPDSSVLIEGSVEIWD